MPPIVNDQVARFVGLFVGPSEPCRKFGSDRDTVCVQDSSGPIVMALSTTFYAMCPETIKFGAQHKGYISPFKIIQGHRFRYQSKAHVRLLIQTIASQVPRIKTGIYESARNLYRWRRAVALHMFTTRHSTRKLSVVMALSTTFT